MGEKRKKMSPILSLKKALNNSQKQHKSKQINTMFRQHHI
ncbi:hypothetical protein PORCRE_2068 [Porphyromonas crevioricanis JCM 15906]|uniref:Uncharacterized protein n=1 Tax=Porphyromonas crevioricanis JCM 15906 TaxID=1305617 RepID=T1DTQ6_9PORP|nr:hypothetical protein PORCRE_2068 [Porphyromonas crevioricanis JCM 15906]GAD06692.1 hypothetical protein PORCAN_291 [Porphyromonas crevioricanis JCM 13913]